MNKMTRDQQIAHLLRPLPEGLNSINVLANLVEGRLEQLMDAYPLMTPMEKGRADEFKFQAEITLANARKPAKRREDIVGVGHGI